MKALCAGRIGQFFESFRTRFFGVDDNSQNPGGADPAEGATTTLAYAPPRSGPALDYPDADAFDENSSLTELTALAFDRVHDPHRDPAVDENMQALWEMMKSPRGDGDFWQAAAYGAANRELLDPKNLGVDQYMNYRPGLDPGTKEAAERSQELLALAYRRNAELLYNEPHDVWQPGDRSDSGLLSFHRVHRALYASEEHMRAYNEHVAAEGNGPYWAADPEERRTLLHDLTGGPENPEGTSAYAASRTEQTTNPLNHPQRDSLENRDDEPGLLYHTAVLAELQVQQLNQHLRFQTNILANPEATDEMRNSAWLNTTDALVHIDYLTGLQDYTADRLEQQMEAERALEEEQARQRSVMGRLRSLFRKDSPQQEPVA